MNNLPSPIKKFCKSQSNSPICCELGVKLANQPQIIKHAQDLPGRIDEICYYLEKQPFITVPTQQTYPTTDCNREDIHLGCSFLLKQVIDMNKIKK